MVNLRARHRTPSHEQDTESVRKEIQELGNKADAANKEQVNDLLDNHLAKKAPGDRPQWLQMVASAIGLIGRDRWLKSLAVWIIQQGDEKCKQILLQNGGPSFKTFCETMDADESRRVVTAKKELKKIWHTRESSPDQDNYGVPSKYTIPNVKSWPRYRQICSEAAKLSCLHELWPSIIPSAIQNKGYGILTESVLKHVYDQMKRRAEEAQAISAATSAQFARSVEGETLILKRGIDQLDSTVATGSPKRAKLIPSPEQRNNDNTSGHYPSPAASGGGPDDFSSPDAEVGRRCELGLDDDPLLDLPDITGLGLQQECTKAEMQPKLRNDVDLSPADVRGDRDDSPSAGHDFDGVSDAGDSCGYSLPGDDDGFTCNEPELEMASNHEDHQSRSSGLDSAEDGALRAENDETFQLAMPTQESLRKTRGRSSALCTSPAGSGLESVLPRAESKSTRSRVILPSQESATSLLYDKQEKTLQTDGNNSPDTKYAAHQIEKQIVSPDSDKRVQTPPSSDLACRNYAESPLRSQQELIPPGIASLTQHWEKPWLSISAHRTIEINEDHYRLPRLFKATKERVRSLLIPLSNNIGRTCVVSVKDLTSPVFEIYCSSDFQGKSLVEGTIRQASIDLRGTASSHANIIFRVYPQWPSNGDNEHLYLEILHQLSNGLPIQNTYDSKTLRQYFDWKIENAEAIKPAGLMLFDWPTTKERVLNWLIKDRKINDSSIEQVLRLVQGPHDLILDPSWAATATLAANTRRLIIGSHVKRIMFAVEYEGHWSLNFLDQQLEQTHHYDSWHGTDSRYSQQANETVKNFIAYGRRQESSKIFFENKSGEICNKATPRQQNDRDCGIFTLVVCIYKLCDLEPPQDIDSDLWRLLLRAMVSGLGPKRDQWPDWDSVFSDSGKARDRPPKDGDAAYKYYEQLLKQVSNDEKLAEEAYSLLSQLADRRRQDSQVAIESLNSEKAKDALNEHTYKQYVETVEPELRSQAAETKRQNDELRKSKRAYSAQWLSCFAVAEVCILNAVSFARYLWEERSQRVTAIREAEKKLFDDEERRRNEDSRRFQERRRKRGV